MWFGLLLVVLALCWVCVGLDWGWLGAGPGQAKANLSRLWVGWLWFGFALGLDFVGLGLLWVVLALCWFCVGLGLGLLWAGHGQAMANFGCRA